MIPTIEQIIEDLLAGSIPKSQAIGWLYAHAEGAANELRDHFAANTSIPWEVAREHVFDMRAEQATYTAEEASIEEIVAARAALRMMEADAMMKARQS